MFIHNYTYSKQIVNIRYRMVTYYFNVKTKQNLQANYKYDSECILYISWLLTFSSHFS